MTEQTDRIDARLLVQEGTAQERSACLMLTGSILGFLGFVFGTFLGMSEERWAWYNIEGADFPSGKSYFPETVSEMVHEAESASGKAFFGFILTGAICILLSWYPWILQNCYVGENVWAPCGFTGLFLNLRSLLPPIGMMVVACLRVKKRPWRRLEDTVVCNMHSAGAVLAIGGFCLLELMTLLFYTVGSSTRCCVARGITRGAKIHDCEWYVRMFLMICCAVCIVIFQVAGILVSSQDFGHQDKWVVIEDYHIQHARDRRRWDIVQEDMRLQSQGLKGLFDTASGIDLYLKQLEFWGENFAGLFMIVSHWVIWYCCEERRAPLSPEARQGSSGVEMQS